MPGFFRGNGGPALLRGLSRENDGEHNPLNKELPYIPGTIL